MRIFYKSTCINPGRINKELPILVVADLQNFIKDFKFDDTTGPGELHDLLLEFRTRDNERLMIHQLEPIFIWLCRNRRVWNEQDINVIVGPNNEELL
jgi:hypothetical protein